MTITTKERRELCDYLLAFEKLLVDSYFLSTSMKDIIRSDVHNIAHVLQDSYDDIKTDVDGYPPTSYACSDTV